MLSVDWIAPSAPAGTSSGEISVPRMSNSTAAVSSETSPLLATNRIRCWISVFDTEAFGL